MKMRARGLARILAAASCLLATPGWADPWIDAGREGNRRAVIDLGSIGPNADGSIRANLMVFPRRRSVRDFGYEGWIARYNCATGTRIVTAVRRYSPDHDPILETPSSTESGPDVRRQTTIVCDPTSRDGRPQFPGLRDLDSWIRR